MQRVLATWFCFVGIAGIATLFSFADLRPVQLSMQPCLAAPDLLPIVSADFSDEAKSVLTPWSVFAAREPLGPEPQETKCIRPAWACFAIVTLISVVVFFDFAAHNSYGVAW